MPATESRVRTGRHSATRRGVGARGMLTSDPLQSLQALGAIFSVVVRKARTTEQDAPTYHCTIGRGFTQFKLRKSRVKNGRMPEPNVRNVSDSRQFSAISGKYAVISPYYLRTATALPAAFGLWQRGRRSCAGRKSRIASLGRGRNSACARVADPRRRSKQGPILGRSEAIARGLNARSAPIPAAPAPSSARNSRRGIRLACLGTDARCIRRSIFCSPSRAFSTEVFQGMKPDRKMLRARHGCPFPAL